MKITCKNDLNVIISSLFEAQLKVSFFFILRVLQRTLSRTIGLYYSADRKMRIAISTRYGKTSPPRSAIYVLPILFVHRSVTNSVSVIYVPFRVFIIDIDPKFHQFFYICPRAFRITVTSGSMSRFNSITDTTRNYFQ